MTDQKNTILAIVLSALVLIVWQFFVGTAADGEAAAAAAAATAAAAAAATAAAAAAAGAARARAAGPAAPGQPPRPAKPCRRPSQAPSRARRPLPGQQPTIPGQPLTREAVLAASPRVAHRYAALRGSISLRGGRIDDLALTQYRETVEPELAADRAARAVGQPASVLRRIRLGRRRRNRP